MLGGKIQGERERGRAKLNDNDDEIVEVEVNEKKGNAVQHTTHICLYAIRHIAIIRVPVSLSLSISLFPSVSPTRK